MLKTRVLIAVALLLAGCNPEPTPSGPAGPLGIRQPLHTGIWRGAMGGTMVDFNIDQVSST
ncbi:MAG TPA: hypothetical protein VGR70_05135, partial [Stellaceae bacterium]|nr:hypothetical protein [Stellaceae bacterium]